MTATLITVSLMAMYVLHEKHRDTDLDDKMKKRRK